MPGIPDADLPITYIGTYHYHEQEQIQFSAEFDLAGIESCEYVRVLWWFDRFDRTELRRTLQVNPPYENAPKSGVFATRSPVRPNLIASTIVKVMNCDMGTQHASISGGLMVSRGAI